MTDQPTAPDIDVSSTGTPGVDEILTATMETGAGRAPTPSGKPSAEAANDAPAGTPAPRKDLQIAPKGAPEPRPDWLPAKYKTPQDLAKAHAELESKLGGKGDAKPAAPPLDFAGYAQEVTANGALSEASLAQLQAAGIPPEIVQTHVRGLQAIAQGVMSRAMDAAGGEQGFQAIAEWASENADPSLLEQFNAKVASGNEAEVMFAVRSMRAMYEAAGQRLSTAPATQVAGRKPAAGSDVFKSRAEQVRAIRDPRYGKDRAYTEAVIAKSGRSTI